MRRLWQFFLFHCFSGNSNPSERIRTNKILNHLPVYKVAFVPLSILFTINNTLRSVARHLRERFSQVSARVRGRHNRWLTGRTNLRRSDPTSARARLSGRKSLRARRGGGGQTHSTTAGCGLRRPSHLTQVKTPARGRLPGAHRPDQWRRARGSHVTRSTNVTSF